MTAPGGFNVEKLEKELLSALEADRKYSRENDAKFRAVNQRVATYEEFREIVKASHLAPLDHDDITGRKGRKQPWNPIAASAGSTSSSTASSNTGVDTGSSSPTLVQFTNIQTFVREWRRLKSSKDDQYQFLLRLTQDEIRKTFKVEVSMGLLGEILEVLNSGFVAEDCSKIMDFVDNLSKSSRFSLSISFLNPTEKKTVADLFSRMENVLKDDSKVTQQTFQTLCSVYEIVV